MAAGAGETLDLLAVELAASMSELALQEARARQQQGWAHLEDALQRPLGVDVTLRTGAPALLQATK